MVTESGLLDKTSTKGRGGEVRERQEARSSWQVVLVLVVVAQRRQAMRRVQREWPK